MELIRKMNAHGNRSEWIRELVERSSADGSLEKDTLQLELKRAELNRSRVALELQGIDSRILTLKNELKAIGAHQDRALENRENLYDQWKRGLFKFWPNESWLEARGDILELCQFSSPSEALLWFNERRAKG